MRSMQSLFLYVTFAAILAHPSVGKAVLIWDSAVGGNDHAYALVQEAHNWDNAKTAAENDFFLGEQGHLVAITSQAENDFVANLIAIDVNPWIGGFQPSGSAEPSGNWQWVTGETFLFANWNGGEPNNILPGEEAIQLLGPLSGALGRWNDQSRTTVVNGAYVVEFAVPEPSSMIITAVGSVLLLRRQRRR